MEMLLLAATQGATLRLVAKGADGAEALEALAGLVARGFDEE
jgi:phosphotransferase system HPr-like phosphotransfer protein